MVELGAFYSVQFVQDQYCKKTIIYPELLANLPETVIECF